MAGWDAEKNSQTAALTCPPLQVAGPALPSASRVKPGAHSVPTGGPAAPGSTPRVWRSGPLETTR